jgi:hypothetical protein
MDFSHLKGKTPDRLFEQRKNPLFTRMNVSSSSKPKLKWNHWLLMAGLTLAGIGLFLRMVFF